MLRSKMLIKVFLLITILFCFHPINNSIAGSCDEKASNGGVSTFSGNFNIPQNFECPENPSLEYDTVNSTKTIDQNGSAALVVIGNNGPYTWSVSGTGFTLETEGEPTGPTNILHANGSACGAATITVTGCDGIQVTGYVRCSTGQWGDCTVLCDGTGDGNCWRGGPGMCQKIEGNRQYWTAVMDNRYNWYQSCCDEVEEGCNLGTCQYGPVCSTSACDVVSISERYWECP